MTFTSTVDTVDSAGSLIPYGLPAVYELTRLELLILSASHNKLFDAGINPVKNWPDHNQYKQKTSVYFRVKTAPTKFLMWFFAYSKIIRKYNNIFEIFIMQNFIGGGMAAVEKIKQRFTRKKYCIKRDKRL